MKNFSISLAGGNTTIVRAETREQAVEYARSEFGRLMYAGCEEATKDELAWVEGMRGRIHEASEETLVFDPEDEMCRLR